MYYTKFSYVLKAEFLYFLDLVTRLAGGLLIVGCFLAFLDTGDFLAFLDTGDFLGVPAELSEDDTVDGAEETCFLFPLVLFGTVVLGEAEESSFLETELESTDGNLSSRRSFLLPANSFIDPILAAAALLLRAGSFAGGLLALALLFDFGDCRSDIGVSVFCFFATLPLVGDASGSRFLLFLFVVKVSVGLLAGVIIVTLRLEARALFVLLGEAIGDSVCVFCFRVVTFFTGDTADFLVFLDFIGDVDSSCVGAGNVGEVAAAFLFLVRGVFVLSGDGVEGNSGFAFFLLVLFIGDELLSAFFLVSFFTTGDFTFFSTAFLSLAALFVLVTLLVGVGV